MTASGREPTGEADRIDHLLRELERLIDGAPEDDERAARAQAVLTTSRADRADGERVDPGPLEQLVDELARE